MDKEEQSNDVIWLDRYGTEMWLVRADLTAIHPTPHSFIYIETPPSLLLGSLFLIKNKKKSKQEYLIATKSFFLHLLECFRSSNSHSLFLLLVSINIKHHDVLLDLFHRAGMKTSEGHAPLEMIPGYTLGRTLGTGQYV